MKGRAYLRLHYKCDHCDKEFFPKQKVKRLQCSKCKKGTKKCINAKKVTMFDCKVCDKPFKDIDKHFDQDHPKLLYCDKCFLQLNSKTQKFNHICRSITSRKSMKCIYCGKDMKKKSSLLNHIEHVHLKSKFACEICGTTFAHQYDHAIHICEGQTKESNKLDYFCIRCRRIYPKVEFLIDHMKFCHNGVKYWI